MPAFGGYFFTSSWPDRAISYINKKESRLRDSPPAAGRFSDTIPSRRSAILAEHFYSIGRIFLLNKKERIPNALSAECVLLYSIKLRPALPHCSQ